MHCFSKTGQDVCKWLAVPWVTASQEQLLVEGVPKGFFPGSNPCGGCKNRRLSLACIPSYGPLKPFRFMRSSWVPVGPWAFLWPFTLGAPACLSTRCAARRGIAKQLHVFALQAM